MSTIRNDEESLLERVETLLKQNPKSQEDILRHLQTELVSLRAKSDIKTIETVFQAFGTAVGTDSKRSLTLNIEEQLLILTQKGGKHHYEKLAFWLSP
jgi:hypothetical protein